MAGALVIGVLAGGAPTPVAAQTGGSPPAKPKAGEATVVTVRGTVEGVDREKRTVTLKGPKRTVTLRVRDPKKLDAIKVGDPVLARYHEAIALAVKKPGTATPGTSVQQGAASSAPGQTPAGAVGEQITLTVTVVAVDKAGRTVTVKGPEGGTETVRVRDPKALETLGEGDLVEITYTRALAVALDKPAAK